MAAWLGGMFDGEGCVKFNNQLNRYSQIVIASQDPIQNPGAVEKLRRVLKLLEFHYSEHPTVRGQSCITFTLKGGLEARYRFLLWCNPSDPKKSKIIDSLKLYKNRRAKVVSCKPLGTREVYALETTSGTYVINNQLSSNSQYMVVPMSGKTTSFQPNWIRTGSVGRNPDNNEPEFIIDREVYDPLIVTGKR